MSRPLIDCQGALDAFIQEYLPETQKVALICSKPANGHPTVSDDEVISKASSAKAGQKFKALMNGDSSGYPSESEARFALLSMLAFWTQDASQLDSIIRKSGLYSDKWERLGEAEIAKILASKAEHYEWPSKSLTLNSNAAASTTVDVIPSLSQAVQKPFRPAVLANAIKDAGFHFAMGGGELHVYRNGAYVPATEILNNLLIGIFADEWNESHVDAVFAFLQRDSRQLWSTPPINKINMVNGIYDVDSEELEPHSPDFLSPAQIPVSYDQHSECPRISRFIEEIVPEDAEITVYELMGSLFTPTVSAQKAFLFVGQGANGKSTLCDLLIAMLGISNVSALELEDLATSNDRWATSDLYGKLANIAGDISSERLTKTAKFKKVVDGALIRAERKYGHPFNYRPYARLVFGINKMFESADTGYAFLRRWIVIRFPYQFPILDITAELQTPEEMSGFFNKAVTAWREAEGAFTTGESIKLEAEQFQESIDPVIQFLNERTISAADGRVGKTALYNAYKEWCSDNGRHPLSAKRFNDRVHQFKDIPIDALKKVKGFFEWPGFKLESGG